MGLDYSEHAEPVDEEVAASWEQHTPVICFRMSSKASYMALIPDHIKMIDR